MSISTFKVKNHSCCAQAQWPQKCQVASNKQRYNSIYKWSGFPEKMSPLSATFFEKWHAKCFLITFAVPWCVQQIAFQKAMFLQYSVTGNTLWKHSLSRSEVSSIVACLFSLTVSRKNTGTKKKLDGPDRINHIFITASSVAFEW